MRCLLMVTAVLASSAVARAETDSEKADRLFDEGVALTKEGKQAEACAKFDESIRFNPNAVGSLLNVARCHEEGKRIATALEFYAKTRDAAREATGGAPEHRAKAEERIAALEPLVPHLTISFAEILTNTKLVIDDKIYPITSASDIRVDPGTRHVVVTAPGRMPYDTTVDIKIQEKKTVEIPTLKPPVTVNRGRKTIGKIVLISGGAVVLTGIGLGFKANSDYDSAAKEHCPRKVGDTLQCDPQGYKATGNALTLGTVGTVVGITGGVAVAVGAYLWFFAPKEPQEHATVTLAPTLSPDGAGVAAVGRF